MPRLLSDAALGVIGRQHSIVHNLVYLGLDDNEMFLAIDAKQDLDFQRTEGPILDGSPQTWVGIGGAMLPGVVEETGDPDGGGQDVQLVALDPTFELGAILLSANPFNRDYQHWTVHYHDVGTNAGQVRASYLKFHGKLNGRFEVTAVEPEQIGEEGIIRVTFRAYPPLALLDVTRTIRTNPESYTKWYSGDLFMDQVAKTANRKLYVGVEAPVAEED